jgi:stage V sporulation protein G
LKIENMRKPTSIGSWGKVRAYFDLQTEEGFIIKGFKLVEGMNGLFVGFPSEKMKEPWTNDDGKVFEYRDTVWAERDLKEQVNQLAVKEYGQDIMSPSQQDPPGNSDGLTSTPMPSSEDVSSEPFSDSDIPF